MFPSIEGRYIALHIAHLFVTSVLCLCVLSIYHAGGQTQDIDQMSGYCWPTVYDAEQTSAQYWRHAECGPASQTAGRN